MSNLVTQAGLCCGCEVWGGPLGDGLHVVDGGVGGGQEQGFPRDHNHTQTTVFIHPPHTNDRISQKKT